MQPEEIECLKKAGIIAKQAIAYARELIKPGMPLLEIA
jgi:methionine aminopeptidase